MLARMRNVLLVLLVAACAAPQPKAGTGEKAQPPAVARDGRRLMVVGINDTHGALLSIPPPKWISGVTKSDIGGAEWFGGWMNAVREDYKAHGDEVVILDAGDE